MNLDDMVWGILPQEIDRLVKLATPYASALPRDGKLVWFNPDLGNSHTGTDLPPRFGEEAWLPIKTAADGAFRPLFDAMQLTPNKFNGLFGGPTPLAGMAAGGLLGAGLGYGGGILAEKLLGPKVLEPGRLRNTLALGGGLAGALPGAYMATVGARLNAEDGKSPAKALLEPNVLLGKEGTAREMVEELDRLMPFGDERFAKSANLAGALYMPSIPVDAFNRTIWQDPNTPIQLRAAATSLVEGASQLRGGVDLVSPFDVGRIAAGMGSGWVSGMLVGKALGALAGLTPQAQGVLKQTGMWTGALRNIVPKAFGF